MSERDYALRVAELERQLAELQARLPAHSIPPSMIAKLDELEEELALARREQPAEQVKQDNQVARRLPVTVAGFEGKLPRIGAGTYVHPSADVFGDVSVGQGCWIGPGARIRGDYGTIVVGDYTSVEDNCVIHARPGEQTTIGNWVTIGHGAIIHNVRMLHDYAIVGMGAVVSDWAEVGRWAVVGEGAVIRQGQVIPDEHIAVGVPARILEKTVGDEYKAEWTRFKETYVDLAQRYPAGFVPMDRG